MADWFRSKRSIRLGLIRLNLGTVIYCSEFRSKILIKGQFYCYVIDNLKWNKMTWKKTVVAPVWNRPNYLCLENLTEKNSHDPKKPRILSWNEFLDDIAAVESCRVSRFKSIFSLRCTSDNSGDRKTTRNSSARGRKKTIFFITSVLNATCCVKYFLLCANGSVSSSFDQYFICRTNSGWNKKRKLFEFLRNN